MNKDQLKGSIKKVAGKIEEKAGKLVGSVHTQVSGAILENEGKMQKKAGDAECAMEKTRHDLKEVADAHHV